MPVHFRNLQLCFEGVVPRERRLLLIILAIGLTLRLNPFLALVPLIDDEAFTTAVVKLPPDEIIHITAQDVHPPLYYLLLGIWTSWAGLSPFAIRLPSAIFGSIAIVLAWWVGRLWCSDVAAGDSGNAAPDDATSVAPLILAGAVALNPALFSISYMARMYAMLSALTLLIVACSLLCIRRPRTVAPWVALAIAGIAACYAHNYGLFLVASVLIWLTLVGLRHSDTRRLVIGRTLIVGGLIAATYAPWLRVLWWQTGEVSISYWTEALSFESLLAPVEQVFSSPENHIASVPLPVHLLMLIAVGILVWPWQCRPAYLLNVVFLGTHAVLLLAAQLLFGRSVFAPRFIIHLLPLLLAPPCYWLACISDSTVRRWILMWLGCVMVSSIVLLSTWLVPFPDVMPQTARLVQSTVPLDALLLTTHERLYVQLQYYIPREGNKALVLKMLITPSARGHVVYGACIRPETSVTINDLQQQRGRTIWVLRYKEQSLPSSLVVTRTFKINAPLRFFERPFEEIVLCECRFVESLSLAVEIRTNAVRCQLQLTEGLLGLGDDWVRCEHISTLTSNHEQGQRD